MYVKCWFEVSSSLAVWVWDPCACWSVAGFGLSHAGSVQC